MRKNIYSLLTLSVIFSSMIFTSVSVFAAPWPALVDYYLVYPLSSPSGRTWYVSTYKMTGGLAFYSSEVDINTVETYYQPIIGYDEYGNPILGDWTLIHWRDIQLGRSKDTEFVIHFDPGLVPENAGQIAVYGKLLTGEDFLAQGPGFMWRKFGG